MKVNNPGRIQRLRLLKIIKYRNNFYTLFSIFKQNEIYNNEVSYGFIIFCVK